MSGRPKPGRGQSLDGQLQADLAAARQQLRELHEAIKDGREIMRDLIDAHRNAAKSLDEFGHQIVAECGEVVHQRLEELTGRLSKGMPVRVACPDCGNIQTLLNASPETPGFQCLGCKRKFFLGMPPDHQLIGQKPPEVYVTTDPGLAPPGSIVIDGR